MSTRGGGVDEESVRDELNCNRAMKKKTKACSREFFVTGVEKWGGGSCLQLLFGYV